MLTKASIFLLIWFCFRKQQDAPSVTLMERAGQEVTTTNKHDKVPRLLQLLTTMLGEGRLRPRFTLLSEKSHLSFNQNTISPFRTFVVPTTGARSFFFFLLLDQSWINSLIVWTSESMSIDDTCLVRVGAGTHLITEERIIVSNEARVLYLNLYGQYLQSWYDRVYPANIGSLNNRLSSFVLVE